MTSSGEVAGQIRLGVDKMNAGYGAVDRSRTSAETFSGEVSEAQVALRAAVTLLRGLGSRFDLEVTQPLGAAVDGYEEGGALIVQGVGSSDKSDAELARTGANKLPILVNATAVNNRKTGQFIDDALVALEYASERVGHVSTGLLTTARTLDNVQDEHFIATEAAERYASEL